ncbi:MAG TPA: hypothetical protein PLT21_09380, partial [Syntrophales bacterium]|nr:hypothetical protein [Syntrophales bacterium]
SRLFGIMSGALGVPESEIESRFGRTLSLALGAYEVSPMENCVLHSVLVSGGRPFARTRQMSSSTNFLTFANMAPSLPLPARPFAEGHSLFNTARSEGKERAGGAPCRTKKD